MGRLRDRVTARLAEESRNDIDMWLQDYLIPANDVIFNGNVYGFSSGRIGGGPSGLVQTNDFMRKTKELSASLESYSQAIRKSPPAFAAEVVRAMVLSQARFTFRQRAGVGRGGQRNIFGTNDLGILERPWPGATTGDLISKMEWHAGLAGNAFVLKRAPLGGKPRLRVLRPDWVAMIYGSEEEPNVDDLSMSWDAELLGYVYVNGGFSNPDQNAKPLLILPEDMAHWFPLPDPECESMGMSWITPAAREMQADKFAGEHKLNFFRNGATPNLVIKGLPGSTKKAFDDAVDMLEERHSGVHNAYKTLYLTGGADATIVGSNFEQMTFNELIGSGETRITALSRVPAIMIGLSEGLKGAALNAGNFGQVRRMFADTWVFPQLQNLAASLAPLVNVPAGAELWYDVHDMPILREDATDAAEITRTQGTTIAMLVYEGGFTHESATAAVIANDMSLLKPIPGWVSVQLQNMAAKAAGNGTPPAGNAGNPTDTPPPVTGKGKKNAG